MKNKYTIQYIAVMSSNILILLLSFIFNLWMTSIVTETVYGSYRYIINTMMLLTSLLNFGFYYSSAKLLTEKDIKEKDIYGGTILIYILISTVVIISTLLFSFLFKGNNHENYKLWIISALFFFTITFQRMFIYMLRGSNKIVDICLQNILPQLFLILFFYLSVYNLDTVSLNSLLIGYVLSFIITHILTIFRLNPKYSISNMKMIMKTQSTVGFPIYKGSLFTVMISDFLSVLVGSLVSKGSYAVYSLALSLSAPMIQIPATMGLVMFKKNAHDKKISTKALTMSIIISILGLITLNIVVFILKNTIYKNMYVGLNVMVGFISIAYVLHGFGDLFNSFLNSKGYGNSIKKTSYYTGAVQLVSAVIFIPIMGLNGLLISRVTTSLAYFFSMLIIYLKNIRSRGETN